MSKKIIFSLAFVLIIAFAIFQSCNNEPPIVPSNNPHFPGLSAGNGCDSANVFCGSPGTIKIQNPCPGDVQTIDLWTGVGNATAGALVGQVVMTFVSGNVWNVTYNFTGATATEIHFAISCSLAGIPQNKSGNPIPGHFPYNFTGLDHVSTYSFDVTLPTGCSCYYVAAHAVVQGIGTTNFQASIPTGCVTLSNVNQGFVESMPDTGCFFEFNLSNAGAFNGLFCGYCIDLGTSMQYNTTFSCARIYSSLSPLPDCDLGLGKIEGGANFGALNYLINHFHPGQVVQLKGTNCLDSAGTDTLTVIDIQKAIWILMDLGPGIQRPEWEVLSTIGKRNAIVCESLANNNFVPNCANGDLITFVVIPDGADCPFQVQPIIGFMPCTAGGTGTAWGDGKYGGGFPGNNWATYFIWCPSCQ